MFSRDRPQGDHPEEEALLALVEGDAEGEATGELEATRRHVAGCALCTRRLEGLRALRRLLQEAATRETAPRRDLAGEALQRLQLRHATVGWLNELLVVLGDLARGLVALFASPGQARTPAPETPAGPAGRDVAKGTGGRNG